MNETVKKILKNILVPIAGAGMVLLFWYVTCASMGRCSERQENSTVT